MRVNIMRTIGDYRLEADLKNAGKSWPQVLAILIACLSSLNNGMLFSWPSPFTPKIVEDTENYDIDETMASFFTTLPPVAMIVTCLASSSLNDWIGRKRTLLLVIITQAFSWTLPAVSRNVYAIYAARILSGVGDGIIFSSVPMYIGEVASPKVGGTWGNALPLTYYTGEFFITVIGSYFSIQSASLICIIVPILLLFTCFLLPESPYYKLMKGDETSARKILLTLTRKLDVEDDFMQLRADVERQMSEQGTWKHLFTIPSNRRALVAGFVLRFSQQMSGLSVSLTCTQTIFEKSGSEISFQTASIAFVGLCMILNFSASLFIDKLGRRKCYIGSLIPSGIVLIGMSIYFYLEENTSIELNVGWVPIAGMLLYIFFSSYGVCIVPTLMMGELFSTSIKAKAMTLLVITFGIAVLLSTTLYQFLSINFGLYLLFLCFGMSNLVFSVLSFYLVPETKGKTLEEIQQDLKSW